MRAKYASVITFGAIFAIVICMCRPIPIFLSYRNFFEKWVQKNYTHKIILEKNKKKQKREREREKEKIILVSALNFYQKSDDSVLWNQVFSVHISLLKYLSLIHILTLPTIYSV